MRLYIGHKTWASKESLKILRKRCDITISDKEHRPTKKEIINLAKKYDGLILADREIVDKEVLDDSKVKFIGIMAKGLNNKDLAEIKRKGIALFHTPESNVSSVSEHVMALILASAKKLLECDNAVRNNKFEEIRHSTVDISNKTLGIIGAGAIAQQVIRKASVFNMNILCFTFNPDKHERLKQANVKSVSLEYLLKNSDFVSINMPLSEKTEKLIGWKELNMMKPSAYLINTSRGRIIDEDKLVKALQKRTIAGAALDVFEEEPTMNKELFKLDNVILTPHVGGVSIEAMHRMKMDLANDIVNFLDGKKTKYRVV